ncbi:hypothetical protein PR048_022742 [Dryococelus australis]|uniref:purine-nucleoside phosphorylase n=1 Tax=Dryococelus australis TaxID=614101 RepID=A0ABQ9GS49_9NEOP|nr:hypothetical protein PR048_022742 [Dryococelus australis]
MLPGTCALAKFYQRFGARLVAALRAADFQALCDSASIHDFRRCSETNNIKEQVVKVVQVELEKEVKVAEAGWINGAMERVLARVSLYESVGRLGRTSWRSRVCRRARPNLVRNGHVREFASRCYMSALLSRSPGLHLPQLDRQWARLVRVQQRRSSRCALQCPLQIRFTASRRTALPKKTQDSTLIVWKFNSVCRAVVIPTSTWLKCGERLQCPDLLTLGPSHAESRWEGLGGSILMRVAKQAGLLKCRFGSDERTARCVQGGITTVTSATAMENNSAICHGKLTSWDSRAEYTYEVLTEIAQYLLERTSIQPKVGIILGTGIGPVADILTERKAFPYKSIPHFPASTTAGHVGELVFGKMEGVPVVCMRGRFHFFEGYPAWQVTTCRRIHVREIWKRLNSRDLWRRWERTVGSCVHNKLHDTKANGSGATYGQHPYIGNHELCKLTCHCGDACVWNSGNPSDRQAVCSTAVDQFAFVSCNFLCTQCAMPVRVMKLMGVTHLIASNASGSIRKDLKIGHIMIMKDHVNMLGLVGHSPLRGPNEDSLSETVRSCFACLSIIEGARVDRCLAARFGVRFPPMNRAYNKDLIRAAKEIAKELGIEDQIQEGVYACLGGPQFETVAEVKLLQILGADCIGK